MSTSNVNSPVLNSTPRLSPTQLYGSGIAQNEAPLEHSCTSTPQSRSSSISSEHNTFFESHKKVKGNKISRENASFINEQEKSIKELKENIEKTLDLIISGKKQLIRFTETCREELQERISALKNSGKNEGLKLQNSSNAIKYAIEIGNNIENKKEKEESINFLYSEAICIQKSFYKLKKYNNQYNRYNYVIKEDKLLAELDLILEEISGDLYNLETTFEIFEKQITEQENKFNEEITKERFSWVTPVLESIFKLCFAIGGIITLINPTFVFYITIVSSVCGILLFLSSINNMCTSPKKKEEENFTKKGFIEIRKYLLESTIYSSKTFIRQEIKNQRRALDEIRSKRQVCFNYITIIEDKERELQRTLLLEKSSRAPQSPTQGYLPNPLQMHIAATPVLSPAPMLSQGYPLYFQAPYSNLWPSQESFQTTPGIDPPRCAPTGLGSCVPSQEFSQTALLGGSPRYARPGLGSRRPSQEFSQTAPLGGSPRYVRPGLGSRRPSQEFFQTTHPIELPRRGSSGIGIPPFSQDPPQVNSSRRFPPGLGFENRAISTASPFALQASALEPDQYVHSSPHQVRPFNFNPPA